MALSHALLYYKTSISHCQDLNVSGGEWAQDQVQHQYQKNYSKLDNKAK